MYTDTNDLNQLDFKSIYHSERIMDEGSIRSIVRKRCAEVLIPSSLSFTMCQPLIVCRSSAERETLLNLLDCPEKDAFANNIHVSPQVFNCHRYYIDQVVLNDSSIVIRYANQLKHDKYSHKYIFNYGTQNHISKSLHQVTKFSFQEPQVKYMITVEIDNHIAYMGKYYLPAEPI